MKYEDIEPWLKKNSIGKNDEEVKQIMNTIDGAVNRLVDSE
jgi:hypothetical protein